jgi:hypothetical protein
MNSNANVDQLKVLVDLLLRNYWRRREKLSLIFFRVAKNTF